MRASSFETVKMTTSFCAVATIFAVERHAQGGVEHDAQQRAAAAQAAAIGEHGVVGEHGVDAGECGVGLPAQRLHGGAGCFAGDPVGLAGECAGRRAGRCGRRASWRLSCSTSGRLCWLQRAKPSLRRRASAWQTPSVTSECPRRAGVPCRGRRRRDWDRWWRRRREQGRRR